MHNCVNLSLPTNLRNDNDKIITCHQFYENVKGKGSVKNRNDESDFCSTDDYARRNIIQPFQIKLKRLLSNCVKSIKNRRYFSRFKYIYFFKVLIPLRKI